MVGYSGSNVHAFEYYTVDTGNVQLQGDDMAAGSGMQYYGLRPSRKSSFFC